MAVRVVVIADTIGLTDAQDAYGISYGGVVFGEHGDTGGNFSHEVRDIPKDAAENAVVSLIRANIAAYLSQHGVVLEETDVITILNGPGAGTAAPV